MTPALSHLLPALALTCLALLRCSAAMAAPASVPAGSIAVSLDGSGMPFVEYALDAKASELHFVESDQRSHDEVRKPFWKPEGRCASLSARGIELGTTPCRARFRLDWDGLPRDRLYPALIRLQSGGVLIFTGYLAVTHHGLPLAWELRAPPGAVVAFRSLRSDRQISLDANTFQDDARGWIYIGPDRVTTTETASVLIDDGVPPVLEEVVSDVSGRLLALFADELATPLANKPTFYLEWNSRDQPGRNLQADVVPGNVIRFGLSGMGWSESQPDDVARLRGVVAHEISHFWNNGSNKPSPGSPPWLHEGNAELLSTAALLKLKLLSPNDAAERLNTAFNSCLLAADASSWRGLDGRDRGQVPYDCGLAWQFAFAAAVQRAHPNMDAFDVWRQLWEPQAEYSVETLIRFLDKHVDAADASNLENVLSDPKRPLRAGFIGLLNQAAVPVAEGGALSRAQRAKLASALVEALMRNDCAGSVSFFTYEDHFLIDDVPTCKNFRSGMQLRYVADEDVLAQPQAALSKARKACASGAPIELRTLDGAEVPVPCNARAADSLPADYEAIHVAPESIGRVLALPDR